MRQIRAGFFNKNKKEITGWLFAFPWLAGLITFYIYPLISSIFYSFTAFKGITPEKFNGIQNYIDLVHDGVFWISLKNTFVYTVLVVPASLIFGILLAIILNVKSEGQGVYRVITFIPTLVPVVAVSIIWQWLLNSQFGLVNYILYKIGLPGPPWFGSELWAKPSVALISLWTIGTTVLIYLAGLQDIPKDYYEAATIDGSSAFGKVIHITLPLLTPVIFFNIIMGIIAAVQQFTLPFIITNGQGIPANSMMFYSMLLYKNAFQYFKMGAANAMAWIMFVIIMILTLIVQYTSKKWVHYMGE
ncbi:MAG: multiple sugar transport system permease protein [Petroclostridium sp.]|jgi:multiple sugar transport system permease protein|nr:spermidine/putrescine transporter permease [Clostridia bacterium]MDK2809427.1 multiple sugar transport system permease protein [Petroclostridium sp.]